MSTEYLIGVDTGGTFTDCVVIDESGGITTAKAASTPPNYADGVVNSLELAGAALGSIAVRDLLQRTRFFGHGTTIGTNTLLTRSGARTGLITTRGHEDMLFMGRIKQKVAGMNEDQLSPGERCASTSNRNFEGRQGAGGRTHLVSPAMAAAAAVAGHFVDVRDLGK